MALSTPQMLMMYINQVPNRFEKFSDNTRVPKKYTGFIHNDFKQVKLLKRNHMHRTKQRLTSIVMCYSCILFKN